VERCGNSLPFEDLTSYKIIYTDPAVEGEAEDFVPDRCSNRQGASPETSAILCGRGNLS